MEIMFINGKTSPFMQAAKFCSFHLLVTPNSSQMVNLIFTPSGVSVIEIQTEWGETTFMSIHYQHLQLGRCIH